MKSQGFQTNSWILYPKITFFFLQLTLSADAAGVAVPNLRGCGRAFSAWRRCSWRRSPRRAWPAKIGRAPSLTMGLSNGKIFHDSPPGSRSCRHRNADCRRASTCARHMRRSTDALTDACMVTETRVWMLFQRLHRENSAYFCLIQEHQAVSAGVE